MNGGSSDDTGGSGLRPGVLAPRLADEIHRDRIVEWLGTRWAVPVVLVEAPGGFGKSVAISQSIRANLERPRGLDLYVACRPLHRDAATLTRAILDQVGAVTPSAAESPEELAGVIATQLGGSADEQACVVLDDLHHLQDHDDAVQMLTHLVRALPSNLHLLLSGRTLPPLPLSRLAAADQVVRIDDDALAFTPDESAALAARHGVDPGELDLTAGWPALTRLALAVDRSAPIDFLMEEVVDGLDGPERRALAATVIARVADDELLRDVAAVDLGAFAVAAAVPLVDVTGAETVRAHDLWEHVLDRLLPADELEELGTRIAEWHITAGRHEDALAAAASVGAWTTARRAVMGALEASDARLSAATAARWAETFPAEQAEQPELVLLRAATSRMAGNLDEARAAAEAALEMFTESGPPEWRGVAVLETGLVSWLMGDLQRVFEAVGIGEELEAMGVTSMRWMLDLTYAGVADLSGDPRSAMDRLDGIDVDRVPRSVAQLVLRWRCVVPLLLGESDTAVGHVPALLDHDPSQMAQLLAGATHWIHGDPEPFRGTEDGERVLPLAGIALDDFLAGAYRAILGSSLGVRAPLDHLSALAPGRSRDAALLCLAETADAVAAGDEDAAARVVAEFLSTFGGDPVAIGELRRHLALVVPLSTELADRFAGEDLHPTFEQRLGLATLLLAARRGKSVDWSSLPPWNVVLTSLPLRWSLELAARLAAAGHTDAAGELATYLRDYIGARVHDTIDDLADAGVAPPDGLASLRSALGPPAAEVRLVVCGPMRAEGADPDEVAELRRARVRELLGLLVLRERVTAEHAAAVLWPGLSPDRARNNLRVTLHYVRDVLEPGRSRTDPPVAVRRDADAIWLPRGGNVSCDLWDLRRHLERGRDLERIGHRAEAVEEFRSALALWGDELLPDVRDHHDVGPEVTFVEMELERAAVTVAEWDLANDELATAIEAAQRLLRHDPFHERAHGVVVGAHLAADEIAAAGEALARCDAALAELGVDPSPATELLRARVRRPGPAAGSGPGGGSPSRSLR